MGVGVGTGVTVGVTVGVGVGVSGVIGVGVGGVGVGGVGVGIGSDIGVHAGGEMCKIAAKMGWMKGVYEQKNGGLTAPMPPVESFG